MHIKVGKNTYELKNDNTMNCREQEEVVKSLEDDIRKMLAGTKSSFTIIWSAPPSYLGPYNVKSDDNSHITLLGHLGDIRTPACDLRGEDAGLLSVSRRIECHVDITYRDAGSMFVLFRLMNEIKEHYKEFVEIERHIKTVSE